MILYQNKLYRVNHRFGSPDYTVVNRMTWVVEDRTNKLPTAIASAMALESALSKLIASEEERKVEEGS